MADVLKGLEIKNMAERRSVPGRNQEFSFTGRRKRLECIC